MEKLLISALEPQKKNKERYNVFVDGEYYASLGAEAIVVNGIRAGEEIDEEAFRAAVAGDNERYAFDTAAKLLAYGMRTRKELEQKLAEKGIDAAATAAALDKLEGYGYINDSGYAQEFVQSAIQSGKSRRVTEYQLREKGIAPGVAGEAMKSYTYEIEAKSAEKAAAALRRQGKDRRHIFAALARKGFDYEIIGKVLPEDTP